MCVCVWRIGREQRARQATCRKRRASGVGSLLQAAASLNTHADTHRHTDTDTHAGGMTVEVNRSTTRVLLPDDAGTFTVAVSFRQSEK